jgi:hypothetical protein
MPSPILKDACRVSSKWSAGQLPHVFDEVRQFRKSFVVFRIDKSIAAMTVAEMTIADGSGTLAAEPEFDVASTPKLFRQMA